MSDKPIEIEFDNKEVHEKLLNLAKRTENLRPLMKNIAGVDEKHRRYFLLFN